MFFAATRWASGLRNRPLALGLHLRSHGLWRGLLQALIYSGLNRLFEHGRQIFNSPLHRFGLGGAEVDGVQKFQGQPGGVGQLGCFGLQLVGVQRLLRFIGPPDGLVMLVLYALGFGHVRQPVGLLLLLEGLADLCGDHFIHVLPGERALRLFLRSGSRCSGLLCIAGARRRFLGLRVLNRRGGLFLCDVLFVHVLLLRFTPARLICALRPPAYFFGCVYNKRPVAEAWALCY